MIEKLLCRNHDHMGGEEAYDETVGKPGEVAASIDINLKCECRSGEIHLEIYSTRLLSPVLQSLATLLFVEDALWIVQPFQDHCSIQLMTVTNGAQKTGSLGVGWRT